ncbi:MAG: hypothetical protein ACOYK9_00705 [Chlamydiia bacterium]
MRQLLAGLLFSFSLFLNLSANEPLRKIIHVDPYNYSIVLDDDSIWNITADTSWKLKSFYSPGDFVVIHPARSSFFSDSKFYFENQSNWVTINTNISLGPISSNPCCIQIEDIDYLDGYVWLVDGRGYRTTWKINMSSYSQQFSQWRCGQAVILGSNRNYDYSSVFGYNYKYILINVEKNHYVQANML